jgi:hypothetical protein
MYESSNPHHIILLSSFKFLYMYILLSYMKDTTLGSVHYIKKYINLELKLCNSINLYLSSTTTIWRVIIINNFIFCQKKKYSKQVLSSDCIILLNTNKYLHVCIIKLLHNLSMFLYVIYINYILYNVINVSEVLYSQFHTPHYPPPPSFPPFVKRN